MELNLHYRHYRQFLIILCTAFSAGHAAAAFAAGDDTASSAEKPESSRHFSGNVSWYGPGLQGRKTASGEIFDMQKSTAAHRTLPFYLRVLVEDPQTGKTTIVKVNDRGPFVKTRVMDLSREGGRQLGLLSRGTTYADCLVLQEQKPN